MCLHNLVQYHNKNKHKNQEDYVHAIHFAQFEIEIVQTLVAILPGHQFLLIICPGIPALKFVIWNRYATGQQPISLDLYSLTHFQS